MAQVWWTVRLNGKKIDSIPCDSTTKKDDVLRSLIHHDGYDPGITISKERAKKPKKEKPVWKTIPDNKVRHVWANEDGSGEITVDPSWYADNGTPVCSDEDSEFYDQDMCYVRTEILA